MSPAILRFFKQIRRSLQANFSDERWVEETTGEYGERLAGRYLGKKGYRVIARNEKNNGGEIDIIAVQWFKRQRIVVFVEVKTWADYQSGAGPADAVDDRKQARLTNAASVFLRSHRLLEHPSRFDVIEVTLKDATGKRKIRHLENAFEAVG